MKPICLWSFKWSNLIINNEKYKQRIIEHPSTDDGFIHVVWWIVKNSEWNIYLHHNAKLNEFMLPWGKVELWESFEEAIKRELHEELGIIVHQTHQLSTIKYIVWWLKRCFHMFMIDHYSNIPINNEIDKYDQYRTEIIKSNNNLWYAIKIDGTITDDIQDIMHNFLDIYHLCTILPQIHDDILIQSHYALYDQSKIDVAKHYYLYLDQEKKEYYFDNIV